jgi:hypothetical protein
MKILIIGAGWYGSHLSVKLLEKGHDIDIVDKENDFFSGSSSKNQNRLHIGFHYPRSDDTINECIVGYSKFKKEYSDFLSTIDKNIYFISNEKSNISIKDYKKIYDEKNIKYKLIEHSELPIPINNVECEYIHVNEKHIDFRKAREYFKTRLDSRMIKIDDKNVFTSINNILTYLDKSYDLIINCTYNHLSPIEYEKYELYVTLLYKIETSETLAYTIMDGPFFSLYPYDIVNNIYTLTSVKDGIIYEGKILKDIADKENIIKQKKEIIENEIKKYIPTWDKIATYEGFYESWKTKPHTTTDDRSLRFKKEDNIIHFYGGKITGIFHAEEVLNNLV